MTLGLLFLGAGSDGYGQPTLDWEAETDTLVKHWNRGHVSICSQSEVINIGYLKKKKSLKIW